MSRFFLGFGGFGGLAQLLKKQDKLIIYLQDAVAWIGKAAHDHATAAGVHRGFLLLDDGAHVVQAQTLAKLDDLRADGDHLIAPIIHAAGKLIADIDAQPAAGVQHPFTLLPDKVQVVDVFFIAVIETNLLLRPIIFQLPIRRRGDDQVHRFIRNFAHIAAVTRDDFVYASHLSLLILLRYDKQLCF